MSKKLDEYDDIMDGGQEPDETPSDTDVSPKGELIPDDVEPKKDDSIDEGNETPKTDEPDDSQVPEGTGEQTPALSPLEQKFVDLGLDKQFKGGLAEAIERLPNMNKYITDLEAQRNALQAQATRTPEPAKPESQGPSDEDWENDPIGTMRRFADSTLKTVGETVNQTVAQVKLDNFIASKPDFNDLRPLMTEKLQENPQLGQLGTEAIPVLYQMAKAVQLANAIPPPPATSPAPAPDKASARTSTGKKESTPSKNDPNYWHTKTEKEIEQEFGYAD